VNVYEEMRLQQMNREARQRGERAAQVVVMKDELWAWLQKQSSAARANEVLKALAWVTEMYTHVQVEGETRAQRRKRLKWSAAAYRFVRCGV